MPIMLTSVAVAMPSTTAARIRNGSTATARARPDAAKVARVNAADVFAADAAAGCGGKRQREDVRRKHAAREKGGDADAGHGADGNEDQAGRIVRPILFAWWDELTRCCGLVQVNGEARRAGFAQVGT